MVCMYSAAARSGYHAANAAFGVCFRIDVLIIGVGHTDHPFVAAPLALALRG